MQVAAQHAKTVSQRAGIGVVEGLLFDGIALHSRGVTPGHLELAALVEADFADAQLPFGNAAAMAAGKAAHKTAVELFVKLAFANVGVKNILERGHKTPKTTRLEGGKSKFGNRNWKLETRNPKSAAMGAAISSLAGFPFYYTPTNYVRREHAASHWHPARAPRDSRFSTLDFPVSSFDFRLSSFQFRLSSFDFPVSPQGFCQCWPPSSLAHAEPDAVVMVRCCGSCN